MGLRYSKEDSALWRKIICIIHGKDTIDWFTLGKSRNSLWSPSVNISRIWRLVEHLAHLKLGSGSRIGFWTDFWVGPSTLKELFPSLSKIALSRQGSVTDMIILPSLGPFPLEEA